MSVGGTLVDVLVDTFVPKWIFGGPAQPKTEVDSLSTFRHRIEMQQAASGAEDKDKVPLRAPGFDYVRWKHHGQHRMHHNPDEYVRTCQGLTPFVGAVSSTAWEGMDERRWAGLTTVPPEIPGLQPKSAIGSRSQFGSRDVLPA